MEGINNYSCADYALFLKRHTLRQAQGERNNTCTSRSWSCPDETRDEFLKAVRGELVEP
jgi:hypothetical protein